MAQGAAAGAAAFVATDAAEAPYTLFVRGARALKATILSLAELQSVVDRAPDTDECVRVLAKWMLTMSLVSQIVGLFDKYMNDVVKSYAGTLARRDLLRPVQVFKLFANSVDSLTVRQLASVGICVGDHVLPMPVKISEPAAKQTFKTFSDNAGAAATAWRAIRRRRGGEGKDAARDRLAKYFVECFSLSPMYSLEKNGAGYKFIGIVDWGGGRCPHAIGEHELGPVSPAFRRLVESRNLATHQLMSTTGAWTEESLLMALAVAVAQARNVQSCIQQVLGLIRPLPDGRCVVDIPFPVANDSVEYPDLSESTMFRDPGDEDAADDDTDVDNITDEVCEGSGV